MEKRTLTDRTKGLVFRKETLDTHLENELKLLAKTLHEELRNGNKHNSYVITVESGGNGKSTIHVFQAEDKECPFCLDISAKNTHVQAKSYCLTEAAESAAHTSIALCLLELM